MGIVEKVEGGAFGRLKGMQAIAVEKSHPIGLVCKQMKEFTCLSCHIRGDGVLDAIPIK